MMIFDACESFDYITLSARVSWGEYKHQDSRRKAEDLKMQYMQQSKTMGETGGISEGRHPFTDELYRVALQEGPGCTALAQYPPAYTLPRAP